MIASVPSAQRTLVTGVTGFAGCYLADALAARGEAVYGLSRRGIWPHAWRALAPRVELYECDLCDGPAVEGVLRRVLPTRVYHLAGYAQVGASFREPEAAWSGNLTATRVLFEAIVRVGLWPRVLFVGSGLVYGGQDWELPRHELMPLLPDTPYAASKAAADLACYQYTCAPGLDVVRARPFNHTGPHQPAQFAIPNFARQLIAIERGECEPVMETGNLSSERDLTDVRDTVSAYVLLMERGRKGEAYNIASGSSCTMQTVLSRMLSLTGLRVELRRKDDLLRPSEPDVIRVDVEKLRRETGWVPRYSLDQTLADTLEAWRRG
jgi:GDP-4-dehydro-6-deoxy-D-mannose reductase